jgi:diadenosine tetraphosphate (Ap4A) HIT family hydrolase
MGKQMKRKLFTSIALVFLISGACIVDFQRVKGDGCPFCKTGILDTQTFFQSDLVLGLITHKPAVPGHVLVIPKRHVERFEELTVEEMVEIQIAIQKIDRMVRGAFGYKDYVLLQKNGRGAWQSVPHVHFHYLPAARCFALRFLISPWLKPLTTEEIAQLKTALMQHKGIGR